MGYLFNSLPFSDRSRMSNVWHGPWSDERREEHIAAGHLIDLPSDQHADVESDFLMNHLPFHTGGFAGYSGNGEPFLFVLQQTTLSAHALRRDANDPYAVIRDSLDRALEFNPGAEVSAELHWTRETLVDAYMSRDVAAPAIEGWPVATLLRGLLAECTSITLEDIVSGYRVGCAFPGITHACCGDVFDDVFTQWAQLRT